MRKSGIALSKAMTLMIGSFSSSLMMLKSPLKKFRTEKVERRIIESGAPVGSGYLLENER
jgi:hypothetical protein